MTYLASLLHPIGHFITAVATTPTDMSLRKIAIAAACVAMMGGTAAIPSSASSESSQCNRRQIEYAIDIIEEECDGGGSVIIKCDGHDIEVGEVTCH